MLRFRLSFAWCSSVFNIGHGKFVVIASLFRFGYKNPKLVNYIYSIPMWMWKLALIRILNASILQTTLRIVDYHFSSRLTANLNLCLIYFIIALALSILLEHMHKKFEINRTKIKGSCQSGRKVVTHNSKSDLPLVLPLDVCIQLTIGLRSCQDNLGYNWIFRHQTFRSTRVHQAKQKNEGRRQTYNSQPQKKFWPTPLCVRWLL